MDLMDTTTLDTTTLDTATLDSQPTPDQLSQLSPELLLQLSPAIPLQLFPDQLCFPEHLESGRVRQRLMLMLSTDHMDTTTLDTQATPDQLSQATQGQLSPDQLFQATPDQLFLATPALDTPDPLFLATPALEELDLEDFIKTYSFTLKSNQNIKTEAQ